MSVGPVEVRSAGPEHLPAVAAIYSRAVEQTAFTFDLEAPDVAAWRVTLDTLDRAAGHELLVACAGEDVLGYAKTGPFRPKGAYRTTAETSVYVKDDARGSGVGSLLYTELIERSARSPLRLLVAGLTEPNPASTRLHLVHGFEAVGRFTGVGTKFGREWDVTWYQRALRP